MTRGKTTQRFFADSNKLPSEFPTHLHEPIFWEKLGRAIGTFGFLEETLAKAIFVFTATRKIPEEEIAGELEKWRLTLEKTLTDPLYNLVEKYIKTMREHQGATLHDPDGFKEQLLKIPPIRNALCHASWPPPDDSGTSVPYYFHKNGQGKIVKINKPVGIEFLVQIQVETCGLAIDVINTVTHAGYQFPGSNGPGLEAW